jgi:ribonucleoside-diphosphate reductase alpha chain
MPFPKRLIFLIRQLGRKFEKPIYDLGLKGLTVYRDGSREQVLIAGEGKEKEVSQSHHRRPRPRSQITEGTTERVEVGCGQRLYVTVNQDEDGLFEVFVNMGKGGGCIASQSEAVGRLISLALRSGVDPESVVEQLKGIRCPAPAWKEDGPLLSCADAVSRAIDRYLKKNGLTSVPSTVVEKLPMAAGNLLGMCPECPDCGTMVEFADGCLRCPGCGYSQCG